MKIQGEWRSGSGDGGRQAISRPKKLTIILVNRISSDIPQFEDFMLVLSCSRKICVHIYVHLCFAMNEN